MIRILATLTRAMQCRLHSGLGKAAALFACEGTYRFGDGQSVSEGMDSTIPFLRNASRTPDDSIRINSLAAGGAGPS